MKKKKKRWMCRIPRGGVQLPMSFVGGKNKAIFIIKCVTCDNAGAPKRRNQQLSKPKLIAQIWIVQQFHVAHEDADLQVWRRFDRAQRREPRGPSLYWGMRPVYLNLQIVHLRMGRLSRGRTAEKCNTDQPHIVSLNGRTDPICCEPQTDHDSGNGLYA